MEKLRDFTSLEEIRNYLDTIPEEKWKRGDRGDHGDPNSSACAIGQIEIAMYGTPHVYELPEYDYVTDPVSDLLNELIPEGTTAIAEVNNTAPPSKIKETVVAFLDQKIAEKNQSA